MPILPKRTTFCLPRSYHAVFNAPDARFRLEGEHVFPHALPLAGPDALVALAQTYSYVTNALTAAECEAFGAACRALGVAAAKDAAAAGAGLALPLVSRLFQLRRIP